MKIIWLTNVPLARVNNELNNNSVQLGGWLDGMSDGLLRQDNIEFLSIFPFKTNVILKGNVENIHYTAYPSNLNDRDKYRLFKGTIQNIQPDLIHIFGTEFKQSLTMLQVCKELNVLDKTIVNIQGLCSKIADVYYSDLPNSVINSWTFRDVLKIDNIKCQKKKFTKRGKYEIEALKLAKNVIGRTDWDKACTTQINPSLKYYFCNETLRDVFYNDKWNYSKCEKHSIFVSQCNYPIKGFHKLLQAMPKILNQYPDAIVYTTGKDLLNLSFKDKLKLNSYQKYLLKLITKNNLQNHVKFLGMLDAKNMKKAYLNANCFISCSSIENSPNSVGEAMLLGVPTISSDVGGVKNMLVHNKEGYIYPFDEEYMIAYYVDQIFRNKDCKEITQNAIKHASNTHNKETNFNVLWAVYKDRVENFSNTTVG